MSPVQSVVSMGLPRWGRPRHSAPALFCANLANLFVQRGRDVLRYLDRLQPLALLVMRLSLGAIMTAHGYQNVFRHLHDHVHMVASLGMPAWLGYVSSFTELLGGLLIRA